jgi:holo-[acyl-carrier protein] synthase
MAVIGLGIDLVDIDRAERMLARHGDRALRRLLFPAEQGYVTGMAHPARHLAVRLAAKEAVFKAFQVLPGSVGIGWRDIEVLRDEEGRPTVALHGRAEAVARLAGGVRVHLSLSHTDRTAGAVAILERDPSITE